jgi:cobalt-zinc-cadmium efflux system outer membrane protein
MAGASDAPRAEEVIPLTLAEALDHAERQSPELAAARDRALAQAARADATGRGRWPRASLSGDWSRSDNPARVFAEKLNRGDFTAADFALERLNHPGSLSHLTTSATLEVPVDVFGKVGARAAGEQAVARGLEGRAREARQDARLRVVEAFERARLLKSAVGVAERAVAAARARAADLSARVEQGAALPADLLRVRARRRQREADLAGAREALGIALATLGRAIGAPAGMPYEPADSSPGLAPLEGTLAEWQERAGAARGALDAGQEQRAAAELALRAERRSRLPDVGAYAQLQDDRGSSANARSYAVGASLRWGLFDPGRARRVAAARSDARAAESEARAAADQVRLEVEVAWRRAQSARERHAAAVGGAEEGREALRVVQERRRAGRATLTDELETDAAALASELEELTTAAEIVIADASLRRAAGGL